MIPRVASKGYGFAGAGLYYLSDKRPDPGEQRGRPTPEDYMLSAKPGQLGSRVGFTETRNLPTRDPHKALRCMQWLAAHATDVRLAAAAAAARAAGMSYQDYIRVHNPMRGRRGEKPVYTLSVSWHPSKNKTPTKAEMIAAGDEVLARLDIADRQCLMVSHVDTAHPHLHLIVNRVSPLNGKFAKLSNDYLKLSAWALDYERRTGHILCVERMLNWEKRRGHREAKAAARKTDPAAKGRYVRAKDTPRPDHEWWQKVKHLPDADIRAARSKKQTKELAAFETRMAKGLLNLEARIGRTLSVEHRVLSEELAGRKAAHEQRVAAGRGRGMKAMMRRLADTVSGWRFRSQRRIKAIDKDIAALEMRMGAMRGDLRARYASEWAALERRHHAERQRDEFRLKARGKERGDAAITRARQAFNARGRADTAAMFVRKDLAPSLAKAYRKAARNRYAARLQGRTALARGLKGLGSRDISVDRLRRESLVVPGEERGSGNARARSAPDATAARTGDTAARTVAEAAARDAAKSADGRAGAERAAHAATETRAHDHTHDRPVRDATSDRETAIAAEMDRIAERRAERVRRKRNRPRGAGRVRRMD